MSSTYVGKHRAPTHHYVRWALVSAGLILAALWALGTAADQPTETAPTPAPVSAAMPHCAVEDGSSPGQAFPCVWDGLVDGNGSGAWYILAEPAGPGSGYELPTGRPTLDTAPVTCSAYEQELAQQAASHGYPLHLACSNPTDGAN